MVRLRPVWMTNHPPSVLWHCWLDHQTCKNSRPYNLYCVGADVKPCSIKSNQETRWAYSTSRPHTGHQCSDVADRVKGVTVTLILFGRQFPPRKQLQTNNVRCCNNTVQRKIHRLPCSRCERCPDSCLLNTIKPLFFVSPLFCDLSKFAKVTAHEHSISNTVVHKISSSSSKNAKIKDIKIIS